MLRIPDYRIAGKLYDFMGVAIRVDLQTPEEVEEMVSVLLNWDEFTPDEEEMRWEVIEAYCFLATGVFDYALEMRN